MKKQFKLMALASAAMLFAACSQEDLLSPQEQLAQNPENNAIQFGTYMGKAGTRATTPGNILDKASLATKGGFGVFAYYTGTKSYNEANYAWTSSTLTPTVTPNFMFNEAITSTDAGATWTYSPLKYWPNEVRNDLSDNDADNNGASTAYANGGNVSFFAYAPYVSNGALDTKVGITAMSANNAEGDPKVTYTLNDGTNTSNVDLLWGTNDTSDNSIFGGSTNTGVSGNNNATDDNKTPDRTYEESILGAYTTNADLTKQKTGGKVKFAFKHALAKFGGSLGLKIKTDVDAASGGALDQTWSGSEVTAGTKVTVNSVTIVTKAKNAADGAYYTTQAGTFNLATGQWTITSITGTPAAQNTYTIAGANLNDDIKEPDTWAWTDHRGVYETAQYVYKDVNSEDPLYFIPGTYPELTVTVDYYVRTRDAKLESGYSEVRQVITKKVTFASPVELNKYYKLLIRLGLTSVKFDASVSDWEEASAGETDVTLPINVE